MTRSTLDCGCVRMVTSELLFLAARSPTGVPTHHENDVMDVMLILAEPMPPQRTSNNRQARPTHPVLLRM